MALDLVVNLLRKIKAGVVHRQEEALYLQGRVKLALDDLDGVKQLCYTLKGEILALHRHNHGVGGCERVDGDEAKRGAAVDEDVVILLPCGGDGLLHDLLAILQVEHLYLGAHKVYVARHDIKAFYIGGIDGIVDVGVVNETLIDGALHLVQVHSQTAG